MREQLHNYLVKYASNIVELIKDLREDSGESEHIFYEKCCKLMEAAIESDSDILIGIGYYHLATYSLTQGDKDEGKINLLGCINYLHGKGPYQYISKAYYFLGEVEFSQNNMVMAVEYYENGLSFCDDNELWEIKAILLCGIASCYDNMGQDREALEQYCNSLTEYENADQDVKREDIALISLIGEAECLLKLGRKTEAEMLFSKIQNLSEIVEPKFKPDTQLQLFYAMFYKETGMKQEALKHLDLAGESVDRKDYIGIRTNIIKYIHLLLQMEEYDRIDEALRRLNACMEDSRDCDLKMFFLQTRIRYLADRMTEQDLRDCTAEYFDLYYADITKKSSSVLRNLEIRKQLRQLQEKQQELKILNEKLLSSSLHDALTGLPNRGYLNEHSEKVFERSLEKGKTCAICLIDIDYFKQLNDRYGHMEGDKCLKAIGKVLESFKTRNIFCARYGGDEFTLVITHLNKIEIEELIQQICTKVKKLAIPNEDAETTPYITLSVGCFYGIPDGAEKLWDFFSRADAALYKAKCRGKNTYFICEKE